MENLNEQVLSADFTVCTDPVEISTDAFIPPHAASADATSADLPSLSTNVISAGLHHRVQTIATTMETSNDQVLSAYSTSCTGLSEISVDTTVDIPVRSPAASSALTDITSAAVLCLSTDAPASISLLSCIPNISVESVPSVCMVLPSMSSAPSTAASIRFSLSGDPRNYCEACKVRLNSESQAEDHYKGKSHQKVVNEELPYFAKKARGAKLKKYDLPPQVNANLLTPSTSNSNSDNFSLLVSEKNSGGRTAPGDGIKRYQKISGIEYQRIIEESTSSALRRTSTEREKSYTTTGTWSKHKSGGSKFSARSSNSTHSVSGCCPMSGTSTSSSSLAMCVCCTVSPPSSPVSVYSAAVHVDDSDSEHDTNSAAVSNNSSAAVGGFGAADIRSNACASAESNASIAVDCNTSHNVGSNVSAVLFGDDAGANGIKDPTIDSCTNADGSKVSKKRSFSPDSGCGANDEARVLKKANIALYGRAFGKNSVSILNDFRPRLQYDIRSCVTGDGPAQFIASVEVDGKKYEATNKEKHIAKLMLANKIVNELWESIQEHQQKRRMDSMELLTVEQDYMERLELEGRFARGACVQTETHEDAAKEGEHKDDDGEEEINADECPFRVQSSIRLATGLFLRPTYVDLENDEDTHVASVNIFGQNYEGRGDTSLLARAKAVELALRQILDVNFEYSDFGYPLYVDTLANFKMLRSKRRRLPPHPTSVPAVPLPKPVIQQTPHRQMAVLVNGKCPVSLLENLFLNEIQFDVIPASIRTASGFTNNALRVKVAGIEADGEGINRKIAKNKACAAALKILHENGTLARLKANMTENGTPGDVELLNNITDAPLNIQEVSYDEHVRARITGIDKVHKIFTVCEFTFIETSPVSTDPLNKVSTCCLTTHGGTKYVTPPGGMKYIGTGKSKKLARMNAAEKCLRALGEWTPIDEEMKHELIDREILRKRLAQSRKTDRKREIKKNAAENGRNYVIKKSSSTSMKRDYSREDQGRERSHSRSSRDRDFHNGRDGFERKDSSRYRSPLKRFDRGRFERRHFHASPERARRPFSESRDDRRDEQRRQRSPFRCLTGSHRISHSKEAFDSTSAGFFREYDNAINSMSGDRNSMVASDQQSSFSSYQSGTEHRPWMENSSQHVGNQPLMENPNHPAEHQPWVEYQNQPAGNRPWIENQLPVESLEHQLPVPIRSPIEHRPQMGVLPMMRMRPSGEIQLPMGMRTPMVGMQPMGENRPLLRMRPQVRIRPPMENQPPMGMLPQVRIQPPMENQPPMEMQPQVRMRPPIKNQPPMVIRPQVRMRPPMQNQPPMEMRTPMRMRPPLQNQPPMGMQPQLGMRPTTNRGPMYHGQPIERPPQIQPRSALISPRPRMTNRGPIEHPSRMNLQLSIQPWPALVARQRMAITEPIEYSQQMELQSLIRPRMTIRGPRAPLNVRPMLRPMSPLCMRQRPPIEHVESMAALQQVTNRSAMKFNPLVDRPSLDQPAIQHRPTVQRMETLTHRQQLGYRPLMRLQRLGMPSRPHFDGQGQSLRTNPVAPGLSTVTTLVEIMNSDGTITRRIRKEIKNVATSNLQDVGMCETDTLNASDTAVGGDEMDCSDGPASFQSLSCNDNNGGDWRTSSANTDWGSGNEYNEYNDTKYNNDTGGELNSWEEDNGYNEVTENDNTYEESGYAEYYNDTGEGYFPNNVISDNNIMNTDGAGSIDYNNSIQGNDGTWW